MENSDSGAADVSSVPDILAETCAVGSARISSNLKAWGDERPSGEVSAASRDQEGSAFCEGHTKFTVEATVHSFRAQGEIIVLKHDPDVFPPSSFGLKFAEQVDFQNCHQAADIGTGTGLLAILAAKKGVPEIQATDLSERAAQLAAHNAINMNGVNNVETRSGHFFCDLKGKFDVITANLPQEIIPPAYENALSRLQSQAINGGGPGGNAILLEFLDLAPAYMHSETRLYVIVNTITDYKNTLQNIEDKFEANLAWEGMTNVKTFVQENISFFRDLMEAGVISIEEDERGNWRARQFIYRLALKQGSETAP